MKMLLRCPKNKPYVERSPLNMCPDLYGAFDDQYEFEDLNGKVVAECDIEVEKINYVEYADEWGYESKSFTEDDLIEKSCLSGKQLFNYLKHCNEGGKALFTGLKKKLKKLQAT